jgi:hypothetical protein
MWAKEYTIKMLKVIQKIEREKERKRKKERIKRERGK